MSGGTQIVLAYANTFVEVVSDGANWLTLGSRETVAARYSGTTSAISSAFSGITFSTKIFDSHSAYGLSGIYTEPVYRVPAAGKYSVASSVYLGAGAYTLGSVSEMRLVKTGEEHTLYTVYSAGNANPVLSLSDVVQCVAGDALWVQVRSTGSGAGITNSTTSAYLSIGRIGD
jgi:hypothetical protein